MQPDPYTDNTGRPIQGRRHTFKHAVAVVAATLVGERRAAPPWIRSRIQRLADRGLQWMDDRRERRDRDLLGS